MSGGSRSSTATTSRTLTSVRETNLQDTGGVTLAQNSGPVTLVSNNVSTSSGAFKLGRAAVRGSVELGAATVASNSALAADGFNTIGGVSMHAINLGRSGLRTGASLASAGMDNAAAAYQSGLTFANNALSTVATLAQQQNAGLAQIAAANSAPPGAQSTSIGKTALLAAAVVVALVMMNR